MYKFAAYILILVPGLAFGQLFPKVIDFKGNIERVTEKRYGMEVHSAKGDSGVFKPGKYSGWKYTYLFDKNSTLAERSNEFQGKGNAVYLYWRDTIGNRIIIREIVRDSIQGNRGDYIEYENITDPVGRVEKANFWSYNIQKNLRELFLVDMNAEYDNDKLIVFTRYNVKENGEFDSGEKCNLFYDNSGRLIRIERYDLALNMKTIIYYSYNSKGFIDLYSIDFLVGLRNNQNTQKLDIYFKYDRHGNWVKRYYVIDGKRKLEAKREIKYD